VPKGDIIKPDSERVVAGQGMPSRHGAFGDLYVKFKVEFPDSIEQEPAKKILKALGGPDKKQQPPVEPHDIEEVSLHPFEDRYFQHQPGQAGDNNSDDEEGGGHGGMPGGARVQCAQQ